MSSLNTTSHKTRDVFLGKSEGGPVLAGCERCGASRSPKSRYCGDACRFWSKVRKTDGCWLWTASRSGGRNGQRYGQFTTSVNGQFKVRNAHVFSYELHHGPVPEGLEVMHGPCNNGLCVRPDHLSAGTHRQNVQDAARDGLYHVPRPTRQLLTDEQVDEMVRLVQGGMLRYVVAQRFGVSKAYVTRVMSGTLRQYRPSLAAVERTA